MKSSILTILGLLFLVRVYGDNATTEYTFDPGAALPILNNVIRMLAEDVQYKDGTFTSKFIFKNETALKQISTLGFPVFGNIERAGKAKSNDKVKMTQEEEMARITEVLHLDCSVDGVAVDKKLTPANTSGPGSDYEYYYAVELELEPDETKTVVSVFKYEGEPLAAGIMNRAFAIRYVLTTGKFWRDSIGSVHIKIMLPVDRASYYFFDDETGGKLKKLKVQASPASYRFEKDGDDLAVIWNYIYLEPTFDIKVAYSWEEDPLLGSVCSRQNLVRVYNAYIKNGADEDKKGLVRFFELLRKDFLEDIYVPTIIEDIRERLGAPKENGGYESIEPMLLFATNAIYALNGYSFPSKSWKKMFREFDWYRGTTRSPKFSEKHQAMLSELEALKTQYASSTAEVR